MKKLNTDLVVELAKLYSSNKNDYYEKTYVSKKYKIKTTVSEILSDNASRLFGKDKGKYITIDCDNFDEKNISLHREIENRIFKNLNKLIRQKLSYIPKNFLVVGLGNSNYSCDALGTFTINKVLSTRKSLLNSKLKLNSVAVLNTNVFGKTGIESIEIVQAISEKIVPDIVIIIDSLVASSISRLCSSFQISSGGIVPGSGIGNSRQKINDFTIDIPTITLGVPMIINAKDIVSKKLTIKDDFAFCPYNIDTLVKTISTILSRSINKIVQPNIDYNTIEKLFN